MKQSTISIKIAKAWNKLPLILRLVLTGLLVSWTGVTIWSIMLSVIAAPWSVVPMIIVLWIYLAFFSGSWGIKKNIEVRRNRFRTIRISSSVWRWGIIAAVFFVFIVQSSFVITFRLIDFPAEKFTADYKEFNSLPSWIVWVLLIMSSFVAGICEETGFRGYMQQPLEKRYGPSAGIIITSIIFMLFHLGRSWALTILPHIFFASVLLGILAYKCGSLIPGIIGHSILDIFDYSFWWSDIAGGFHKQTIFRTGIDIHFLTWGLIFILAIYVFFWSMRRLTNVTRIRV